MFNRQFWKSSSALVAAGSMLVNSAAFATSFTEPTTTLATTNTSAGFALVVPAAKEPALTSSQKWTLLREKIKHVFVIFQENRSFDSYFGTYPGANGLYATYPGANPADPMAQPASATASFTQNYQKYDASGSNQVLWGTVTPFLSPRTIVDTNGTTVQLYPESKYSVDHSHTGYINDFHLQDANRTQVLNDGYALDQEGLHYSTTASTTATVVNSSSVAPTTSVTLQSEQKGLVVMAHDDCDDIPFLWQYADLGTLFDNFHQTITGPSTPNAIAMIAAQTGATQWALHPSTTGTNAGTSAPYAVPNETDSAPFAGGSLDKSAVQPPYGPDEESEATCATAGVISGTYNNSACTAPTSTDPAYADWANPSAIVKLSGAVTGQSAPQIPLTFASLPLSFMGHQIKAILKGDENPAVDEADIQQDIAAIKLANPVIGWGWYQQGFGPEPFDGTVVVDGYSAATKHASYIVHHNGPQYFGYLGDNPIELAHMHSLQQFYTDIQGSYLAPGVYYVRGGYYNNDGLQSYDPSPAVRATFSGNDDHGSYSDSQISEAMVADTVNAIAQSKFWQHSAIIITYDESDGFYDHAPLAIRNWSPDGMPMSGGPRIPAIVLSPFMAAHTVSHVYAEHGSVISFINKLFGLTPLSQLPNEAAAQALGATETAVNGPNGQANTQLNANDGSAVSDMSEAFDNARLLGSAKPVPAAAVIIPAATVLSLPHYAGAGCTALGITPTDYPNGYATGAEIDPPPADYNPRPTVSPGIPSQHVTEINTTVISTTSWTP